MKGVFPSFAFSSCIESLEFSLCPCGERIEVQPKMCPLQQTTMRGRHSETWPQLRSVPLSAAALTNGVEGTSWHQRRACLIPSDGRWLNSILSKITQGICHFSHRVPRIRTCVGETMLMHSVHLSHNPTPEGVGRTESMSSVFLFAFKNV